MTLATSRAARQQRIVEILRSTPVRSQTELLDVLAADGIEVTQATLSRDLVDVGAERVRVGKSLVYAVPGEGGDAWACIRADPCVALAAGSAPLSPGRSCASPNASAPAPCPSSGGDVCL